ncbi:MAG: phosphate transport system regulatory protein PhoU [Robiginitomaculum sp.]|nr:MAG: phosphate transport system regulatory protein PhoU [Robiginitomaculum sp.]
MNEDHIVTSFNDDLNHLESLLLTMGGLVEQQLIVATTALQKRDRSLAKQVLMGDRKINELEAELNDAAIKVLALRQPFAADLRNVVMTLKIAAHLERIGDYTKNMARRTNTITKAAAFIGSVSTLVRMSELVQNMITAVLDAYNKRDIDAAEIIRAQDESVDQMLNTLFRELLTYMMEDTRNISGCMHLLFIAKNIERMGDHAAEIAQEIIFLVTGEWPQEKRIKGDITSKMIVNPDDIENKSET